MRTPWAGVLLAVAGLVGAGMAQAVRANQRGAAFVGLLDEHPAIQYAQRATQDRVSALNHAIDNGSVTLSFEEKGGYLRSVLNALDVPAESQILVFSKTGIQRALTDPVNPRALYFNDSTVVGYIHDAPILEFAVHDPEQGVVFYTLDQAATAKPSLRRRSVCVTCHVSGGTLEVPGLLNRSVFTRPDGSVIPQLGFNDVDHRTPLLQRWGGMYVTGNYLATPYTGRKEHMGNVTVASELDGATTSNEAMIRWLNSQPDARGYMSKESDIASMMVFDHQAHAINLVTKLNWESRVDGMWKDVANELADYFLFVGEVAPPARLSPRSGFAAAFTAAAPVDRRGRSLRQLDLESRLLRYPCSYMIYTEAFDHLSAAAKNAVYLRMWTILSGADTAKKYAHLSPDDRRAIIEILRDTKSDLPPVYR